MIDLRSDTVTKPTPGMRHAMANAEVGDDVIDIDPTVARLEEFTAELLGKEIAVYMPSGSMTNQIAIRIHCDRGDEFLCEENCHIYNYEQAAFAQLSGLVARTVPGDFGVVDVKDLLDKVRPLNDHMVHTKLLCLENTHNRGGGRVWPYEKMMEVCQWAHQEKLICHLDGARLFNAVAATGIELHRWAEPFKTVSVCYSKGLGAPIGSALAGPRELLAPIRRARKLFGGGMRQAGIIAAGALYALEHHRDRLVEDHVHAQMLADTLREIPHVSLKPERIDSNIVIFEVNAPLPTAQEIATTLAEKNIRVMAISKRQIRMVTHLDVSKDMIQQAQTTLREVLLSRR